MKVLVDLNIPKKVYRKLRSLGFDVVYLTDILPAKKSDRGIIRWMTENKSLILTRDKRFPETENGRKIVLAGLSSEKLAKEAVASLIILQVFPRGLEDSAELNIFSSFMKGGDPFFRGLHLKRE
jgi:predicted nuclease of predicted toxin-antitoxin system